MEKIKSIAVPVTRRPAAVKRSRAGRPPVPHNIPAEGPPSLPGPQHSMVPRPARPRHRFRVGDRVHMNNGGRSWARPEALCRIMALLPHENGPFLYRVRSEVESFERVVAEEDLSPLR